MTTEEVAGKVASLCREGKFDEAMNSFYSPDIVSMEAGAPPGQSRESKGIDAVRAKGEWWVNNHEIHSVDVHGPLVAGSHFSIAYKFEVTRKETGQRMKIEEIAVYRVDNGKVVYEEFFYVM